MSSSSVPAAASPSVAASSSRQLLSPPSPRSRSSTKTKGTVRADRGGDWSAEAPSQNSTLSDSSPVPLIDLDRSAENSAYRFPVS